MKSDLDQLIDYYEAQKVTFEQLLEDCFYEQDYLDAHYYSVPLNLIETKLQLLQKFKGTLYDEKQTLKRMVDGYNYNIQKKLLKNYSKAFWEKRIEDQKLKIQELSEQKGKFFYDSQEIDNAIFHLYERKIKSFQLYLKQDDNFYFEFNLSEANGLEISIETKSVLNNSYSIYANIISFYKKLGFKLNDEESMLTFKYDMNSFKDTIDIKKLLAHLIFNLYSYQNFDQVFLLIKN